MRTEKGIALRAVGANLDMAQAQGISVWWTTIAGVGLAAALSAFAGTVLVQSQGFSDVNIGFGVVINGLASVIIGELLVGRRTVARQLLAPVVGAIAYYQLISMCLALGLAPSDLQIRLGPARARHARRADAARQGTCDGAREDQLTASLYASALSSRRITLPVVVSGKVARNAISRGYSCAERRERTKAWMSEASASDGASALPSAR